MLTINRYLLWKEILYDQYKKLLEKVFTVYIRVSKLETLD